MDRAGVCYYKLAQRGQLAREARRWRQSSSGGGQAQLYGDEGGQVEIERKPWVLMGASRNVVEALICSWAHRRDDAKTL